jgi:hypothetical protein
LLTFSPVLLCSARFGFVTFISQPYIFGYRLPTVSQVLLRSARFGLVFAILWE